MAYKTSVISQFKGLSQDLALTSGDPSYALACVNCIPSVAGLAKLRVPVPLTAAIPGLTSLDQFAMAEGTDRKDVLAFYGDKIYTYSLDAFTPTLAAAPNAAYAGPVPWSVVEANNVAYLQNGLAFPPLKFREGAFSQWGIYFPSQPLVGDPVNGVGGVTLTQGRKYRVAFKNSQTGHVGQASAPSDRSFPVTDGYVPVTFQANPPEVGIDNQVDRVLLYATLDGGEDFFFQGEFNYTESQLPVTIPDPQIDANLDQTRRAPLLNALPPLCKYLTKWGARIFLINTSEGPGSDRWVAYTGYNRISEGVPEETVPPGNRIKCQTGADELVGGGVMDAGMVVFDKVNKAFMFRGQPEDIVITAPVEFSLFFKELPWGIGCAGHFTIQSTPYGLIWLGADHGVYRFNGAGQPESISDGVEALLRSINIDQIRNCRSAYWGYKGRDWYVLAIPVQDSTALNRLLVFDLTPGEANVGTFPLDIGPFESLGTIEMVDGTQKLVIGQNGQLKELTVTAATINGISDLSGTSASEILGAFWQSGYFGNDDPGSLKFFRYGRIVVDSQPIRVKRRLIRDDVRNPGILEFQDTRPDGKISTNKKARRLSYELRFVDADVSQNILELIDTAIPVSEL